MNQSFYISVYFQNCLDYNLYYLNEKNELAISLNRRVCSFFSDSLALFETVLEAQNFLSTLKVDDNRIYKIEFTSRKPKISKKVAF